MTQSFPLPPGPEITFPVIAKSSTEFGGHEVATAVSIVIVAMSAAGRTKESAET